MHDETPNLIVNGSLSYTFSSLSFGITAAIRKRIIEMPIAKIVPTVKSYEADFIDPTI